MTNWEGMVCMALVDWCLSIEVLDMESYPVAKRKDVRD